MPRKRSPTHHPVVPRRSTVRIASGAVLTLLFVACAGPTGPSAATSITPPSVSSAPSSVPATSTPVPTPEATATAAPTQEPSLPADAAPIELQGTWADRDDPADLRLLIEPVRYRITRSGESGAGAVSVTDDLIRFSKGNLCPDVGEYRWTLVDDVLSFTPIGPDGCPGRARSIKGITYVRLFPPS